MNAFPSEPSPVQKLMTVISEWCQRTGIRLMRIGMPSRPLSIIIVVLGALHAMAFSAAMMSGEIHGWKDWIGPCFLWPLALRHCDLLRKRARPVSQD